MLKVGITGKNGFIGNHLFNILGLYPDQYDRISFERTFFQSETALDHFVRQCDVIVHLAGINRHTNAEVIYETNILLVRQLIGSLKRTRSHAHVLFSSSLQEERDTLYGQAKREGRELLTQWSVKSGGKFTGLIIPNVFGPFALADYNSFVATFCYRLTHGEEAKVEVNASVKLIYIAELIQIILCKINQSKNEPYFNILPTSEVKVSEVLNRLEEFKNLYYERGIIPEIRSAFDRDLFNTFRSYIDNKNYFPIKFPKHIDERGLFVEIIRLNSGGQVSFSTTSPGVTRGNHYHTRKIERFAVIRGNALIQMRKIGTGKVFNFEVNGDDPGYVDIPIWYTHNIKNIGAGDLYTIFWINEPFNQEDRDTFFEIV